MAKKERNLNAAAKAKKDEFYTQLTDIEKEMRHYRNERLAAECHLLVQGQKRGRNRRI